ncbi:MAG: CopG family transcriptional regulator [Silvibacterium sp.]|nr:CopG family transcriptional regulator [Silvibacterium sp.]
MAVDMKPVTFRTPSPKLDKIDALAEAQQRDRTFILNEAIDHYLAMQEYHIGLIQDGLRDAEAGNVVSHQNVGQALAAERASRKSKARR